MMYHMCMSNYSVIYMAKKISLDKYEQEIEDSIDNLKSVDNLKAEIAILRKAADSHVKRKKAITIRISEVDLEAMKLKASRLGIPYQTYINMIIHKDATKGAFEIEF